MAIGFRRIGRYVLGMIKVRALYVGLVVGSAAIGGAIGLWMRLPTKPDENNMLGLFGSLIGAGLAVITGLVVLARQFETADERHLRTTEALLKALKTSATALNSVAATNDPRRYVGYAYSALRSAQSVTRELQAAGPNIAAVAQLLEESDAAAELIRLKNLGPDLGIQVGQLQARGNETVALADNALDKLKGGL